MTRARDLAKGTFSGDLTVDTNTLVVDSANNRVGVGTASPRVKLDLRSDAVIAAPTPLANAVTSGVFAIGDSVGSVVGLQLNGSSYDTYIQSRNMGAGSAAYNLLLQPLGGNVGIGTTTSLSKLTALGTSSTVANGASTRNPVASFRGGNNNNRFDVYVDNSGATAIMGLGAYNPAGANTDMAFYTGSTVAERVRIASNGYVGFGLTSPTTMIHLNGGTADSSNSGIAAAWNVHSDYRLKENVVGLSNASSLVSQLRPVKFSWVGEDQSEATTAGFIAHEMAEVAPYSVMGEKDAVNEDGSINSQAADYSKLVPLLTAALQEALNKIEAMETRLAALEAN
jgi:hypothetical protein